MWISGKTKNRDPGAGNGVNRAASEMAASGTPPGRRTTKQRGDAAENLALAYLEQRGLTPVCRNFRTPGRGGGEIDLIMRERDGTLVFVEVRQRRSERHGGADGSVTVHKQQRIVLAARHFLAQLASEPPCRFDVVLVGGDNRADIRWLNAAFDASATF